MNITEDTLIYDIETRVFGKPDCTKDELRIFGCYSYKTNKYYLLKKKEDIQKIIDAHKYLVGFNNQGDKLNPGYDNPILEREGIKLQYKIIIDLRKIIKQRAGQMKIKKGYLKDLLMEYSLDYITKTLDLVDEESSKIKINYEIFMKEMWTKEETEEICKYTMRDLEVTKKLYEFCEEYFWSFRDFLNEKDIEKKLYLRDSLAKVAYKAICKAMNWEEKYNTNAFKNEEDEERISGGYVSYPAGEFFKDNIYCFDFNSLYSRLMIQCNLYARKKEESDRSVWKGGGKFKVEGEYYADEMHPVGKLLKQWYIERQKLQVLKDRKEYAYKIFLNIVYGILDNPYYEQTYDKIAAGDCTRLGRQCNLYMKSKFRENGYQVAYCDTDSNYVIDVFNNKDKLLNIVKQSIDEIKQSFIFPDDSFNMKIEAEIKYLFFFKGEVSDKEEDDMDSDDIKNKPLGLLKKNYIYITTDGKMVIKNLGIVKKSTSMLSKKIFWDYFAPKIKEGQIKFSRTMIQNIMYELLEKDISFAAMRKEVGNVAQYTKSESGMACQISQKYGSGIHFLIPINKNIGVGKEKHYITVEDFKKMNMKISDINLDVMWNELDYFIKEVPKKNIFDFDTI